MSDVFGAEVYSSPETRNSAAIGGAIQAAYCYLKVCKNVQKNNIRMHN